VRYYSIELELEVCFEVSVKFGLDVPGGLLVERVVGRRTDPETGASLLN
jgi:hypothetical protein